MPPAGVVGGRRECLAGTPAGRPMDHEQGVCAANSYTPVNNSYTPVNNSYKFLFFCLSLRIRFFYSLGLPGQDDQGGVGCVWSAVQGSLFLYEIGVHAAAAARCRRTKGRMPTTLQTHNPQNP